MANRGPASGLAWLLLAIVLVGGWMAWPRPQAQSPAAGAGASTYPPVTGHAPRTPAAPGPAPASTNAGVRTPLPGFLPPEAHATIEAIRGGGPFPHRQDGSVFGNREGHLPRKPRGWYREYTVDTPGLDHRGARRIVTGGDPPREWYYSDDHYDSFRRFDVPGGTQ